MPLSVGDRLGPYEILALIGKGGMGEVYRARDPRLNRDVAIKISNAQFTERFTREARAIAALNHTNICHLYDVGPDYLVMEYVEGQDLRGPMDFEDALPIVQQLIDGIEAAHEKNIIHRDLKPANIKITPEGVVKILDFGLAKAMEPPADNSNPENSPTLTMGATVAGTILGTAAYMAPEQAKGKTADKRSDIWSFGVIVYEVLTGKRLFQGESAVEILGGVLNQEPDISAAPQRVHRLLRWCLEKDRKQRLTSISDARRLLAENIAAPVGPAPSTSRLGKLPWIAAAVLAVIALAVSFVHFREAPPPEQTTRYSITLPENSTVHSFALSPDGRALVMAARVNGKQQLWLRPMDAVQAQPMAFTEDATYPFWSPDSRYIGFFAQGKLKKIAGSGGPAQSLCDAPLGLGGSWNRDGVIVFSTGGVGDAIQRVTAAGGVPDNVMKFKGYQHFPVFLPDGRHFLYMRRGGTAEPVGIYVSSLDGKENRRVLADNTSSVVFAPSARSGQAGHILFVRENTLMALPFDAASAQASGDVFPVAEGVSVTSDGSYLPSSASDNGVLLYDAGGGTGGSQLGWFDRSGKSLGPAVASGAVYTPAISPDEKSIVFRRMTGTGSDLRVRDLSRGTETRFTNDPSTNALPFWSPKGDRIVFGSNRKGALNLYQKAASGSGQDELLLPNSLSDFGTQWSRDGRFIVYFEQDPKNKYDLWVLPAEGAAADRKPIPFLRTEFNELHGQLSPDSHWMAFTSDRSGRREVYVRPFPNGEGEWTISLAGGEQPRWRGDGKELFFEAADGKMMAVPVIKAVAGAKPSFEAGTPIALFDAHMVNVVGFQYDVTADGKRFLITTAGTGAASPPLTVVTNWQAGLKK
jgi:serine/threonine protein kinase